MPVTDEQVAALRAFLAFDPACQDLVGELSGSGGVHGFGELVYAAFVTAARRRFSPTWTSAQVVRFAARLRVVLRAFDVDLDPRAIEILLRQALGEACGPAIMTTAPTRWSCCSGLASSYPVSDLIRLASTPSWPTPGYWQTPGSPLAAATGCSAAPSFLGP